MTRYSPEQIADVMFLRAGRENADLSDAIDAAYRHVDIHTSFLGATISMGEESHPRAHIRAIKELMHLGFDSERLDRLQRMLLTVVPKAFMDETDEIMTSGKQRGLVYPLKREAKVDVKTRLGHVFHFAFTGIADAKKFTEDAIEERAHTMVLEQLRNIERTEPDFFELETPPVDLGPYM